jgi:hypothetical protein
MKKEESYRVGYAIGILEANVNNFCEGVELFESSWREAKFCTEYTIDKIMVDLITPWDDRLLSRAVKNRINLFEVRDLFENIAHNLDKTHGYIYAGYENLPKATAELPENTDCFCPNGFSDSVNKGDDGYACGTCRTQANFLCFSASLLKDESEHIKITIERILVDSLMDDNIKPDFEKIRDRLEIASLTLVKTMNDILATAAKLPETPGPFGDEVCDE